MQQDNLPNLYKDYLLERESAHVLELEQGLCVYKHMPEGLYLQDIFVHKSARASGLARRLFEQVIQIAKQHGHSKIFGTVDTSLPGAEHSAKIMLLEGFKFLSTNGAVIWLVYEV